LIQLTTSFRGPAIPTDIHLGGCVYTRYGGGNSVITTDELGNLNRFIYDPKGKLIPDQYKIPFVKPDGVHWPFDSLTSQRFSVKKKTLRGIYRPTSILKPDPRGSVFQAVYLKGWLRTNTCVIKEGKSNMCSDAYGRDIRDRLVWQQILHK